MKLKVTILFLILAGLLTYFVLKGSYFSFKTEAVRTSQGELTANTIFDKLYSSELKDYQGLKISIAKNSLDEYQTVIVHLWASWCGPCVGEVPELIAFAKLNPKVKFIIVSLDESKDDINKFLKSFPDFNSDKYIKIWDSPSELSTFLNADRLPMSLIIRKNKTEPQFIRSVVDWQSLRL